MSMVFEYFTSNEALIRHYHNYIWFKENGKELTEEIRSLFLHLKNNKGQHYTIKKKTEYHIEGRKIIINSMFSICNVIIDHLSYYDYDMIKKCHCIYKCCDNDDGFGAIIYLSHGSPFISYKNMLDKMESNIKKLLI